MPDVSQSEIGILPCPGGIIFAQKIYSHLESIAADKTAERVAPSADSTRCPAPTWSVRSTWRPTSCPPRGTSRTVDQHRKRTYLVPAKFTRFPNGGVQDGDPLLGSQHRDLHRAGRGQPLSPAVPEGRLPQTLSVNDHILCLLVTVDAALQAGALQVTVVLRHSPTPAAQEEGPGEPVRGAPGADPRILRGGAHHHPRHPLQGDREQLQPPAAGKPPRRLPDTQDASHRSDLKDESLVVVAPDTGAVDRSKFYASILGKPSACCTRRGTTPGWRER